MMTLNYGELPELFSDTTWRQLAARARMTPRQLDVARLMCRGLANKQVALWLGLSINTIGMHQRLLFRRLNVHDRVGLVVRFVLAERELRAELAALRPTALPVARSSGDMTHVRAEDVACLTA